MDSLKKKDYTNYQNNHEGDNYCMKTGTNTTCFCTGHMCNKDISDPTSGVSSNAGGVLAMAGAILLARVV